MRKWCEAAGHRPELPVDDREKLHNLAVARATAAVASGKLSARTVAVIAGIARRNLRANRTVQPVDEDIPSNPEPLTTAARQRFVDWLDTLEPEEDRWAVERSLHAELRRHADGPVPEPPDWPDTDTDARVLPAGTACGRRWRATYPGSSRQRQADALEAARNRQRDIAGRWLEPDVADLLAAAEAELERDGMTATLSGTSANRRPPGSQ